MWSVIQTDHQKSQIKKKRLGERTGISVLYRKKEREKNLEKFGEKFVENSEEQKRQERYNIEESLRKVRSLGSVVPPKCREKPNTSGVRNYGGARTISEKPDENTNKTLIMINRQKISRMGMKYN